LIYSLIIENMTRVSNHQWYKIGEFFFASTDEPMC
jgi:hypothetical protein